MFYRVGFTRVGGQGVKDGWQAVNISPDVPPEVIGRYAALQNSNAASEPIFDAEDNREKIVIELQTDKHNAYLSRIKYGLADERGRPSMFTDSFIFDIKQFAENPGEVLRVIKNSNFSFDLREIHKIQTQESLDLFPEFTINIDFEKYSCLIKYVYSIVNSRTKEPLHIICGDLYNDENIAGLMFCIYSALFLPFRKNVTFSTYELKGGNPNTIIFERRIDGFSEIQFKYYDLETGQSNIPDSVLKKYDDYGFIDEITRNPQQATLDYYKCFEKKLKAYGCAEATSLNLYKLVFEEEQIDSFSDSDLSRKLNELLSIDVPNRTKSDEQIIKVFCKILGKNIVLNDIVISKLANMPYITSNQLLAELCTFYVSQKVKTRETVSYAEAAAEFVQGADEMPLPEPLKTLETEEIPNQNSKEIPDEFYEDFYEGSPNERDGNPIKKFINIFTKKKS